tara:strand:- start:1249 stop:1776 length:528 start_codon:yes stop_codon:yes gene_type:complete
MTDISTLETVAEIGVALAGFAGIVATFQFRQNTAPTAGEIVALTIIVNMGLSVAAFSYLPILALSYTSNEGIVWSISSSLLAVYMSYMMYFIHSNLRGKVKKTSARLLFTLFQLVGILIVISLISNALNIGIERGLPAYLTALVYGAYLVGMNFMRLLLLPIWKQFRASEASNDT